ncbi:hypothetical protein ACFL35_08580 [Candidatus Riflebacteria bacterium]
MENGKQTVRNIIPEENSPGWELPACLLLCGLILTIDILLPTGVAKSVLYLIPVLLPVLSGNRTRIFQIAVLSYILTALGFVLSPAGEMPWVTWTNRFLALLAIVASVFLLTLTKKGDMFRKSRTPA